jgi:glycosyltransferase involved in cell wall biosynthesis
MTFGRIATELARRGHDVTVFRPRRDDLIRGEATTAFKEISAPGIPIPNYPLLRLGLPAGRMFRRRWRSDRPDLVHVVTEGPLGSSAISAARALDLPVTSSFHTNFHAYTQHYGFGILRWGALAWLRRVHNRTLCTFAPTMELCRELRGLGFRTLNVLSRGVDLTHFNPDRRSSELRKSWGAGPDDLVVLHVGRMAAEKNFPLLFRAFTAMRAANPRIRCVIAGEGPLKAELMRAHPEYTYIGFYSREEIGRCYASADLYVHPSLTETFGNVLTEAMASGLPVAGFDYAAAHEFVRHEENGLVVPCDQADALVAAGVRLATNDALRHRLGARARHALLTRSWSHVAERFAADLDRIVKKHSAADRDSTLAAVSPKVV